LAACTISAAGLAQGQGIDIKEAQRIPVPVPENVKLAVDKDRLVISWDPTPIQRVIAYEVYRKATKPVRLGKVEKPPFVITPVPKDPAEYYVVAVDYRGNRSQPSEVATYAPPKQKPNR
jgi:hypothetical protein